jgi:YidC/Oxa1 family membrane protein insertase
VNQDPSLDRSALTGILLIALIMGMWLVFYQPPIAPPAEPVAEQQAPDAAEPSGPEVRAGRAASTPPPDTTFAAAATGEERLITVETDLYRAVFSTRGGTLRSLQLLDYTIANTEDPVELIGDEEGALALAFTPPQGRYVDTRSLFFQTAYDADFLDATDAARELVFEAPIGEGVLRLAYTFDPDSYEIGFRIEEEGSNILTASGGYEVIWDGAIPFAEASSQQEATSTGVYARSGGELERLTLARRPEQSLRLSGSVEWVAVKNKYFLSVLVPRTATEGAELEGRRFGEPGDMGFAEDYAARLLMPRPQGQPAEFALYAGPLDMQRLGRFAPGIYQVVDYGFGAFMTRPIAEYVVGPLFRFFGRFLPNYGLVIILFALFVKIALYPLTKASYKNTARMRELQPKMEAIKEKYGDDPQKQQEAMLKMYKETGINPLAGCLPLLLQYPIIIALWQYFQNSIVIRQESFLWAHDLSAPDPILNLPFTIPLYGDFVAGFTLIMGLAMIVQMKVSMPPSTGGAQAKIFMYVLPLVLFVVFNRLASGLSLYYLVFNVATIVQQKMINNQMEAHGVGEAQPDAKKIKPAGRSSKNGEERRRAGGPRPVRKRS